LFYCQKLEINVKNIELLAGRILLAHIFILAGINKLGAGYAATEGYMEAIGIPGILLPAVIVLEVGAGLALIAGIFTRYAAWSLALFSILAAAIFHADLSDQTHMIMFMKNIAIAGGLLMLAAAGAGGLSIDNKRLQS